MFYLFLQIIYTLQLILANFFLCSSNKFVNDAVQMFYIYTESIWNENYWLIHFFHNKQILYVNASNLSYFQVEATNS